jgi:hypothetical protein
MPTAARACLPRFLPQSISQLHVEVKALSQAYGVNTGAS